MRTVIATLLAGSISIMIGGLGFVFAGIYDVSAAEPHWPMTHWLIETARIRSIQAHAAGIVPPPGLDDSGKLLIGTEHFAAHCAVCHGAPGVPPGDIARGLYPSPPNLKYAAGRYTLAELFWIVKNGIKSTGMPSWSDHGDDELWDTVAFLKKLQTMDEAEYRGLMMESIKHSGNHHHGG